MAVILPRLWRPERLRRCRKREADAWLRHDSAQAGKHSSQTACFAGGCEGQAARWSRRRRAVPRRELEALLQPKEAADTQLRTPISNCCWASATKRGDWAIRRCRGGRVAKLPNGEQCYRTRRRRPDCPGRAGPRGVSYAARTFGQLLEPKIAGKVELPLARITDWPDLAERGITAQVTQGRRRRPGAGCGGANRATMRHRLVFQPETQPPEIRAHLLVEAGEPATATLDAGEVNRCRLWAIKMIPIVTT